MIRPLLLAIGVAIMAMPFLAALIAAVADDRGRSAATLSVMMWILLPNLMAIGLPPMLVGTEEENGTLGWLRTLPVRWQSIADAKFVLAAISVVAAWLLGSLAFWLASWVWHGASPTRDFTGLLTAQGIGQAFFFTCLLLMLGFVTTYAIKSPVAALVALLPTAAIGWWLVYSMIVYLLDHRYATSIASIDATAAQWTQAITAGFMVLLGLFALQRWLAKRRLSDAKWNLKNSTEAMMVRHAYQPPPRVTVGLDRPTPVFALLWQQWRQVRAVVLSLFAITTLFIMLFAATDFQNQGSINQGTVGLIIPVATFAFLWMGATTFYGDSVRRRCAYFADRGIRPRRVWWTRVLPTLVPALVLLLMLVFFAPGIDRNADSTVIRVAVAVYLTCCYGFGQFVSMWVKRPTLSFFAAPAYGMVATFAWGWFFVPYYRYLAAALVLAPMLLMATRTMTDRWLDGRIDRAFHWRMVGWTVMAIAIPMLLVLSIRYATTPAEMTDWRKQMMAVSLPKLERSSTRWEGVPSSRLVSPEAMEPKYVSNVALRPKIGERLMLELNEKETVGKHVSFAELRSLVQGQFLGNDMDGEWTEQEGEPIFDDQTNTTGQDALIARRQRTLAIEVLLKWARQVRQNVADGEEGLIGLIRIAAPAEGLAVAWVEAYRDLKSEVSGEFLIDKIPSEDVRKRSRRIGVIGEWQRFNERGWFSRGSNPMNEFAGAWMLSGRTHKFAIERRRAERHIDMFTRRLLEMIDTDAYGSSSAIAALSADLGRAVNGASFDPKNNHVENDLIMNWIRTIRK
ncbi:ABC-2 family transporter protein [Rubripirellula tenax]|uniref:ABC-2 family transporter protein n=1 Tax=Rubripirellula tenax TaxID=2528015 RepID=A0A5C6FIW9_9BACT|nr:ABC-2 family transporter protein [Rubripirellula tenax]